MTAPRCTCSVYANEPSRWCEKHRPSGLDCWERTTHGWRWTGPPLYHGMRFALPRTTLDALSGTHYDVDFVVTRA